MSFLCKKGRAATLLLCAFCFKKGNASLDFELDDFVNKKQRLLPFPISSPGRQQVRKFFATLLAALSTYIEVLQEDRHQRLH